MRAMSRMMSAKRAPRETPRTSANGRDALASLATDEVPYATGDDGQGLASARDSDDGGDDSTRDGRDAADAARLAARLAEAEARVFHLENQLEHASARAESAERRASAAEQRERAAFHERAAASADPGMPRPPRWLETGTGTGTGTETKTNADADADARATDTTSVTTATTTLANTSAREPPSSTTTPAPERGSGVRLATRERVTAVSDAHTQTETTLVTETRVSSDSSRVAANVARRAPQTEAPRFGDASVADAPTDLARARRAARQSGDKERAMVAQLNAYRRAKDQSEARVRELAAELAEAAKDSRAWQSQARRVALGVADAKSSIHPLSDASAREASTPRPSRGGGAPVYLVASDGDVASDSDVSDGDSSASDGDADDAACEGGRRNADDHPVFRHVRRGRVADVAALLSSRGVDPDVRDRFGNTPLIVAAQNDRKRISKLVVKAGADLNAANARGNAALHYCYAYGHFDLAEFLERKGADVSARNEAGVAPRDVLEGDADANARWRAAKRDAETRRAGAEARRRRSESVGGFAGDGDDGFGTDAEGGFETSDDESDGTPRRHAADDQDSGGFAEFANDQEGGLHSYRALVTGRIGRDDA